jgi:hypothetical protein
MRLKVRFASDSPLEGSGFELSVPLGHLPNEAFYIAGLSSAMDVGRSLRLRTAPFALARTLTTF